MTYFLNYHEVEATGSLLYGIFAVMMLMLSVRRLHGVAKVSTLLMSGASAVACLAMVMQRLLHLHDIEGSLGVSIDLSAFMVSTYLMSVSLLYLLRQGRLRRREWLSVPAAWLVGMLLLGAAYLFCHRRLCTGANYLVGALCIAEVIYLYYPIHVTTLKLQATLQEFFDHSTHQMLSWITVSTRVILAFSFILPLLLFFRSGWMILFLYLMIAAMAYLGISFSLYCVSNDAVLARQAESLETELKQEEQPEPKKKKPTIVLPPTMDQQMDEWVNSRSYLQQNISINNVADATGLRVAQLRLWLSATGRGFFSQWLSHLRIEHSKTLLTEHSDWTIDKIAESCGFSGRQSFIRAFKKENGANPGEWAEAHADD